ncbi:MAG: DUF6526 family protein [Candidatus Acidiferrales bacterium]
MTSMAEKTQNLENHAKTVPAFHFFVLPILLLDIISQIVRVFRVPGYGTVLSLLVAIALLLLALTARMFAMTVQDRVIRLEMQLRLQQLLPQDLRPRIPEFTVSQLVSLRFASDAELPDLARKVLDEKLNDRRAIKKLIRNWQPDFLRA